MSKAQLAAMGMLFISLFGGIIILLYIMSDGLHMDLMTGLLLVAGLCPALYPVLSMFIGMIVESD